MAIVRLSGWPARYAERAARIRHEEGAWRLAGRVCRKFIAPIVEWGAITFFERQLTDGETPGTEDAAVREVSASGIAALAAGLDPTQAPEEIARRYRRGDRAFVAVDASGTVAHTRWLTTSRTYIPEIDREVVLAPGQAYFYNGYTRPDSRRCGFDGRVRQRIFDSLRSEGFRSVYSYVRHDNSSGFRAASRWQRPVGVVRYLRIGRGRPFVIGSRAAGLPVRLQVASGQTIGELREQEWRRWFRGWIERPLSARSTGCYEASETEVVAAAAVIVSLLQLEHSDDVLDLGCDSALISRLVAPHCRRFAGIDFISDMLRPAVQVMPGRAAPTWFIAGDGRRLPIRTGAFRKVYCSGMLHTLPSRTDGFAVIDELIRVTADGGTILLGSVPDRRKRHSSRLLVWRRASLGGKLTLPIRWILPAPVRGWARRLLGVRATGPPAFLDYDCRDIIDRGRVRGMTCVLHDFPKDYPNVDFRVARTNLVISVRR